MEQARVIGIHKDEAHKWWPLVKDWCEAALEHGGNLIAFEDVQKSVGERDMQLWAMLLDGELSGVCVTQISVWPQAKTLTAVVVAGERMNEWVSALDEMLCLFARAMGCKGIEAHGRKGWKPALSDLGWRDSSVSYWKEV